MKEVVLRIEDSAFEKIINFLQLCPMVEVVSASKLVETKDLLDKCFHEAVSELRKDKVFRRKGEYGYIMLAINDNVIKGFFFFIHLLSTWIILRNWNLIGCLANPLCIIQLIMCLVTIPIGRFWIILTTLKD